MNNLKLVLTMSFRTLTIFVLWLQVSFASAAAPDGFETPCFLRGVHAGPDDYICSGQWAIIHAYTTNALLNGSYTPDSTVWSSSGDGVFFNKYALYTSYGPGPGDLTAGSVTLTITMYSHMSSPEFICSPATDQLTLYIGNLNDWYTDADHDGYGTGDAILHACNNPMGWGYAGKPDDCDDANYFIHPFAGEICDGLDNNCNGDADDGLLQQYYLDEDGDGHGIPWVGTYACIQPDGYALSGDDCDDANPSVYPGSREYCDGIDNNCNDSIDEGDMNYMVYYDSDGDGFGGITGYLTCLPPAAGVVANNLDCDDDNSIVYPGETDGSRCDEYNGFDDDCDGSIDEDGAIAWYLDADWDGYGDPLATPVYSNCAPVEGYVTNNLDCDDNNPEYNPATSEVCNNIDDNCDGQADEYLEIEWHADIDQDGFGNFAISAFTCFYPDAATYIYEHWVTNDNDCYDEDPTAHPGHPELCGDGVDNNCDGLTDVNVNYFYLDLDGDFFGDEFSAVCNVNHRWEYGWVMDDDMYGFDCNDNDYNVNAWAYDYCDGIDNNCDGIIDNGLTAQYYFNDADHDGYGDAYGEAILSCDVIWDMVTNNSDCNDSNPFINPGATELCSGIDENCNGIIDEGFYYSNYYLDADADGFGDAAYLITWCSSMPGFVENGLDCNDVDPMQGHLELCDDGYDNDCDGLVDEEYYGTWNADIDQDGFGNFAIEVLSCGPPDPAIYIYEHWVTNNLDCFDEDPTAHLGAPELCDNVDNNCNGIVDDNLAQFYPDFDHDGYINHDTIARCDAAVANDPDWLWDEWIFGYDCDDLNPEIPAVYNFEEICNGADDNCDGQIDEGIDYVYYWDADGDGYGGPSSPFWSVCPTPPYQYVTDNTDCFEGDPNIHPGAIEICNFFDDDCDGIWNNVTWFRDADGDGYGNPLITSSVCPMPYGFTTNDMDCNDSNYDTHPFAAELCDGLDNDCDGTIDEELETQIYFADADHDFYGDPFTTGEFCSEDVAYANGFLFNSGDCNDMDPMINPEVESDCENGVDDNCNGEVDEDVIEWHADIDHDGYGNFAITAFSCYYPDPAIYIYDTWVTNDNDCHDEDANSFPGAIEWCDNKDNDCDSQVDETEGSFILYADFDYDGYIDYNNSYTDCYVYPTGHYIIEEQSNGIDCNDADPEIPHYFRPDEICNGIDDDCDGLIDDADDTVTGQTIWYADADHDNYGNYFMSITACAQPADFVNDSQDCNDANAAIHPGAIDICDGVNNDCDFEVDENGVIANITANTHDLCHRSKVALSATNYGGGYTYRWFKNNILIAGANAKTYNATSIGDYEVKITKNNNGCFGYSPVFNIYKSCREEDITSNVAALFVYPNPASDYIMVDFNSQLQSEGKATIAIYDVTGRLMISTESEISDYQMSIEIPVGDLPGSSIFLIRVIAGLEIMEQQVIILR